MRRLRVIIWFKCLVFFFFLVVVDRILDWKIIENTINHRRNIWNTLHFIKRIRDHPFSTYAKFSEKPTFLTSWYAHVRLRIRHSWNHPSPPPTLLPRALNKGEVRPSLVGVRNVLLEKGINLKRGAWCRNEGGCHFFYYLIVQSHLMCVRGK